MHTLSLLLPLLFTSLPILAAPHPHAKYGPQSPQTTSAAPIATPPGSSKPPIYTQSSSKPVAAPTSSHSPSSVPVVAPTSAPVSAPPSAPSSAPPSPPASAPTSTPSTTPNKDVAGVRLVPSPHTPPHFHIIWPPPNPPSNPFSPLDPIPS